MQLIYHFKYDYIPLEIINEEENYNEERQKRKEESIINILLQHKEAFDAENITYTISAEEGEGELAVNNMDTGSELYRELDAQLREIGLENDITPLASESGNAVSSPTIEVTDETSDSTEITAVA